MSICDSNSRTRFHNYAASLLLCAIVLFAAGASADSIRASVAAAGRPEDDRARDEARRPDAILRFFEIAPGQRVAELMTGRGYYAELLSRVVGEEGVVIAQNNAFVVERFADAALKERFANPELANVQRVDAELEAPGLPGDLDAVLMILFYHDTYWQETDRPAMNRAVFEALKFGGVYGVVDHHAEAGSGDRDVKSLHRVDAELVKSEILAAGFVLDAESDVLRHPEDDRSANVFDEGIRGKTDRFVYRFRKPIEK
jgi:predicted methyltransferase